MENGVYTLVWGLAVGAARLWEPKWLAFRISRRHGVAEWLALAEVQAKAF